MAALLNLFVPGLGHLILGKPISGLFWFVLIFGLYGISPFTGFVLLIVAIPMHLICIMRAASIGRKQMEASMERAVKRATAKT